LRRYSQGSKDFIKPKLEKSFQPITEEPRAFGLRLLQPNSDGGISREQLLETVGVHSPRGIHMGFVQISRGPIFSQTDTESVYEVRAHCLRQIPDRSDEFSHQGELSSLAAVVI
jgi:hypothetical protein